MPIGDHDKTTIDYLRHGQRWSAIAFLDAIQKLGLPHKSVLDVGCCVGEWLKLFHERTGCEIYGIDSPHIEDDWLAIPKDRFLRHDLDEPFDLKRRFQLVLCLETAEHVSPGRADCLVESLIRHGDIIIFGAAIPGQGGAGHLNEQPPEYWAEKFAAHGYKVVDCIRPLVWDVHMCEYWYQQSTLVFATPVAIEHHPRLKDWLGKTDPTKLLRRHPKRYPEEAPGW